MSAQGHRLTAPVNSEKVYIVLGLSFALVLITFLLSRNSLPHVGDNIHSLPHGGAYRDGTKAILYNSPNLGSRVSLHNGKNAAFAAVLLLTLLIYGSKYISQRNHTCACGNNHSSH
uniref:Triple gene block protein 2 n=1 Tax=Potato virus X TaxID=12183 RepID=A0A8B0FDJ8_PVX|nr:triple gene block protein 2 [Potato virus X]